MHHLIILFDFDGVIITQKALEYTALLQLRKKWYNWQNIENIRLIDFAKLFEESDLENGWKALRRIYKVYKPHISNKWKRMVFFYRFNRLYKKYEKVYETLRPNLEQTLKKFKSKKIPMGIVSNTPRKRLNYFRKKFQLDKYFSVFISRGDSREFKKPHPYPIIMALKQIKNNNKGSRIDKNKVYFIGDLPSDIQCAKAANINSIALLSGHGSKEELLNSNPTIILQDIKNIFEINPFKKFLLD